MCERCLCSRLERGSSVRVDQLAPDTWAQSFLWLAGHTKAEGSPQAQPHLPEVNAPVRGKQNSYRGSVSAY